jgi:TRAP-type C4-dicarboxylate transport system permease small subunit
MNKETQETPNKFSDTIDAVIRRIGHVLMWANCIVILFIILQVVLRYGFGHGLVILDCISVVAVCRPPFLPEHGFCP